MQNISYSDTDNKTNYLNDQSRIHLSEARDKDNYTSLFQTKVLDEISSTNIDTSLAQKSIKAGKKKKKKQTAEKEGVAIQMLGDSFALPDVKSRQTSPKVSLFSQTYCPAFLEEEQKSLMELLAGSAFCENITLYEVFLMDFYELWNTIIDSANSCDERVKAEVHQYNTKHTLIIGLYKTYLFLSEKANNEFKILDIDLDSLDSSVFPSIADTIEWLDSYASAIPTLIHDIKQIQMQKSYAMKARGIKSDYCEVKFKPLYATLNFLKSKVELFNKCLRGKQMTALMIESKTIQWSESDCQVHAEIICFNYIKKFTQLVKSFAFTKTSSFINTTFVSHFALIEKIINANFSKKNTTEFLSSFKEYSNSIVHGRIYLLESLTTAKFNPTEAKSKFSIDFNRSIEDTSSNKFLTLLFNANLDTNMFDKWINDLHNTISSHFLLDFREVHLSDPQAHFKRLLMLLDLVDTVKDTDLITHSDPLLASIQDLVQTLAAGRNTQLNHTFGPLNLPGIADKIRELLSASSFRFSECLLPLIPLIKVLEKQNLSLLNLNQIRVGILNLIRDSKENFQSEKFMPAQFKIEVQKIVFKHTFSLCIYCMIIEDIKILSTQTSTKEVQHLLPNDLVRLLNLTGIDDILAKYADNQNSFRQESNPESVLTKPLSLPVESNLQSIQSKKVIIHTSLSAPLPLKVPQVSKTIQTPTKEDFQTTKKRVIRELLERLGFVWARTGRHDIYKHPNTNGQVVLPNSLEAAGTRNSIYNQAMRALS